MACVVLDSQTHRHIDILIAWLMAEYGMDLAEAHRGALARMMPGVKAAGYSGEQAERVLSAKANSIIATGDAWACGEGGMLRPCAICKSSSAYLCDEPLGGKRRCDMPLCEKCHTNIGPDLDLCPVHALRHQSQ